MTHATASSAGAAGHSVIPDIPGELLQDRDAQSLRERVRDLVGIDNTKFPGSQPVSFGWRDIEKLKREDYWVCEKSDGVRVLVFILPNNNNAQDVFLIDRHNKYRYISGYYFPHYQNKGFPLRESILDGELVIDTDPNTKKQQMRLLIFDCLVIDGQNVMPKSLLQRTGRLKDHLFAPYERMLKEFPQQADGLPFQIRLKPMLLSYHLQQVLVDIPRLLHGNDGLIYTCASSGYVVGTDTRMYAKCVFIDDHAFSSCLVLFRMKWKPPSENSIDFKLQLRFPPLPNSSKPDFRAKPVFVLNVWMGGRGPNAYSFFDVLKVDDEEWEKMKLSGEQFDDRIAEVVWITNDGEPYWKMLRFRDDKPDGNYIDTVESICRSIADGVEQEDLVKHSQAIRDAWKDREREGKATTSARVPPPPPPRIPWTGLAPSMYSKVSGPLQINGIYR